MITPSHFQEAIFSFVSASTQRSGIVNAVAGSGKTTTLEYASKLLRVRGLFCAFNKHIADRLAERLNGNMRATTIHSIGMSTLYRNLKARPTVEDGKYWELVRDYVNSADELRHLHFAIPRLMDFVKFTRLTLTDYRDPESLELMAARYGLEWDPRLAPAAAAVIDRGIVKATETGVIDFTDMLSLPAYLKLQPLQYPFVFVDECQDLSRSQLELVMKCIAPGGRSLWVGDPAQSIMQFAGADSQSYFAIRERTQAKELPLSICYRCPTSVLQHARQIVPHIQPRPNAPAGVVRRVTEQTLLSAREGDLIMARRNAPLVKHCLRLIKRGVQARVRGRDIGKELADSVRDIGRSCHNYFGLPDFVEKYREQHVKTLEAVHAAEDQFEMLHDKCDAILECFTSFTECRSADALARKIEDIFSDINAAVWLSSIHRAKGLEANTTWLLGFDALGKPREDSTVEQAQQEQNLRYVGITRSLHTMNIL